MIFYTTENGILLKNDIAEKDIDLFRRRQAIQRQQPKIEKMIEDSWVGVPVSSLPKDLCNERDFFEMVFDPIQHNLDDVAIAKKRWNAHYRFEKHRARRRNFYKDSWNRASDLLTPLKQSLLEQAVEPPKLSRNQRRRRKKKQQKNRKKKNKKNTIP